MEYNECMKYSEFYNKDNKYLMQLINWQRFLFNAELSNADLMFTPGCLPAKYLHMYMGCCCVLVAFVCHMQVEVCKDLSILAKCSTKQPSTDNVLPCPK